MAGLPKSLRTYVSGNGRKRSALLVNNKEIGVVIITQLSDEDCIVAGISYGNTKFYGISLYFDITEDIEINIRKIEHILSFLTAHTYNHRSVVSALLATTKKDSVIAVTRLHHVLVVSMALLTVRFAIGSEA